MRGIRVSFFGSAVLVVVVAVEIGSPSSSGMFDGDFFEDVCIGGCVFLLLLYMCRNSLGLRQLVRDWLCNGS